MSLLTIKSKFQETLLLLALVLVPVTLGAAAVYTWGSSDFLATFLGQAGNQYFRIYAEWIGLGIFIVPLLLTYVLSLLVRRFQNFGELWSQRGILLSVFVFVAGSLFVLSGLLTTTQSMIQGELNARFPGGWGGIVGDLLGGTLFLYFGVLGSLVVQITSLLLLGLATGHFQLVNTILSAEEMSVQVYESVMARFRRHAETQQVARVNHHDFQNWRIPTEQIEIDHNVFQMRPAVNDSVAIPVAVAASMAAAPMAQAGEAPKAKKPRKKASKETTLKVVDADLEMAQVQNEIVAEDSVEAPHDIEVASVKRKYVYPGANLLEKAQARKGMSKKDLDKKGDDLRLRLESFGIKGQIVGIHPGARLTMFEFLPDSGVKLSKIQALTTDLALLLGAPSIRMLAPIPGKTTVGIEIPNPEASPVKFTELIDKLDEASKKMRLPIAMGLDVYNHTILGDLASMPHMLVSGTTGSGKSVFVNTLITSLLYTRSPQELRFLMIDPKMIELSPYNGIPHLLEPVISDVNHAKDVLQWAEKEMDRRYNQFSDVGARNIDSFNEKISKFTKSAVERRSQKVLNWKWERMPYIVIIVDEMADLMITQGKEVEIPITRIAQKARACGIHLVLSTQRPSADIVTGLIKTNFPTRVAFKVSSNLDSRTILDAAGAEKLLGNGDMLFMPNGKALERIQASYLSEAEVNRVVEAISG